MLSNKTTIEQWLEMLEDRNWHSECVLVEALMTWNSEYIQEACEILLDHYKVGHLTTKNGERRSELLKKMSESYKKDIDTNNN